MIGCFFLIQLNRVSGWNHQSNVLMENNADDDDEDVIVDQGTSLNVDVNLIF